ncbi:DUF2306 domain-containing protein [Larkinella arboricola]|uniref:Uncharacterized protein n=1 Tax=Larkinella arboricola TaxID=643671 RepID=A0A327WZI1_LARAB|nr:DUF2306 domain-containing protein [Larkinella arboricola]RAJ98136.1 hypothetical protein LX87_03044 [Larkinella arboricola]
MTLLLKTMLIVHIAAGFLALLAGLVPMIAKKGTRLHKLTGLLFYWCMALVCLTAVYLVFFKPSTVFLLFIAILSFYFCFTGRRILRLKKTQNRFTVTDRIAAYLALGASVAMAGLGVQAVIGWLTTGNLSIFGLLYFFFAGILFSNARYDVRLIRHPEKARDGKMEWFYGHISRMAGSYIATATAFATVNTRFLPNHHYLIDIAAWTLPGIIGGMLIGRTIRYYKEKAGGKAETPKTVMA